MTSTAFCRPGIVSSSERSSETTTRPSRSIRPIVCDTVGPEWPRRSEMRARRGRCPPPRARGWCAGTSRWCRSDRSWAGLVHVRGCVLSLSVSHGDAAGAGGADPRIGSMAHVTLPREILPADGRFGCGPSKIRPSSSLPWRAPVRC
jgi:hypothetical protein